MEDLSAISSITNITAGSGVLYIVKTSRSGRTPRASVSWTRMCMCDALHDVPPCMCICDALYNVVD